MKDLIERFKRGAGYYRSPWIKQAMDQAAHFWAAFLLLAPAAFWGGVLGFAFAGLGLGLVREFTEGDGANWRSALDVSFWTLGGAAIGALS